MYIVPNPQTPSWSSPREVFWLLGGMTPGMTRETTAIANSIASICGCLMCLSIFQLPTISAILGLVVSCKMSCCSSSTSQRVSNAPCTKCTAWIGFGFACLTGFLCLLNGGGWLSSALPALQSYDECTAGQGRGQVTAVHCFGFARRRALSEGHRLASLSEDGLGSIAHDWAGAFALFMAKRGMSDADNNTSTAIATAALTPPSSALIPSSKAKANVGYARRKLSHANTVTPGCPSSRPCGTGRACFLYMCVYSWHSHSTYSSSIGICQDSSTCATCDDSCDHASDGDCDDGGPGSRYEWCSPGADCSDCGQRTVDEVSDTPGSGTGLSVWSSSPPPSPRPPPGSSYSGLFGSSDFAFGFIDERVDACADVVKFLESEKSHLSGSCVDVKAFIVLFVILGAVLVVVGILQLAMALCFMLVATKLQNLIHAARVRPGRGGPPVAEAQTEIAVAQGQPVVQAVAVAVPAQEHGAAVPMHQHGVAVPVQAHAVAAPV